MSQPDITWSKRFAEMGQNGHLPDPVIIVHLKVEVAVPFGTPPQKTGGPGLAIPVISHDLCRLHQGQRHSGPVDVQSTQHAWRVLPEPKIPLHNMGDRVSGHRIRQLGRSCDKVLKLKPATASFLATATFARLKPIFSRRAVPHRFRALSVLARVRMWAAAS